MEPFSISLDDYRRAKKLHAGKRFLIVRLVFFVVLSLGLAYSSSVNGRPLIHPANMSLEVVLFFVIFFVSPLAMKRQYKKIYDSHKTLKAEVRPAFDGEALQWETAAGTTHIKWDDLVKAKITSELILVYEAENVMRIIPSRAFVDEDERKQFEERISKHVE